MSTVDFSRLLGAAQQDQTIGWRSQFRELVIGIDQEDAEGQTLRVGPGGISLEKGLPEEPDFTFVGSSQVWQDYASDWPSVGSQSISSLVESKRLSVRAEPEGILTYSRYAMLIEKLFSQLRGPKQVTAQPYEKVEIEPVVGRYIRMNIGGRPHRIYYEEAGEGIPLICLHTAGSDGRQYRAVLNDPVVTKQFRVIVFDLPWHGKSAPPPGFHTEIYLLTTQGYVDIIMAFKNALDLQQPVVMGCSIGGRAVLHLALNHGSAFRAVIGLQSATHADMQGPAALGTEDANILFRPDMDSGDISAAGVMTVMSPLSPVEDEWETLYYYMQSAPGVFQGDLYYYVIDGDMRNGMADRIDTSKCPVYLLTGEYDLSATPEMTRQLAESIRANHFEVMHGLGHFPMSEDPGKFRQYLHPVLNKILAQSEGQAA